MRLLSLACAGCLLSCGATTLAQHTPPPAAATADIPDIVVEARRDPDEPDATNDQPAVIVGSRLPQRSLQRNPTLAMRTSANGLTPDSGMDAFKGDRRLRWTSCTAQGARLSKHAACSLAVVQQAVTRGELGRARALALDVLGGPSLTAEDRFTTHSYLYRIAAAVPDATAKRAALTAMVDSGLMPAAQVPAAVRTLAAMAMTAGDRGEALRRFEQAAALDGDDSQSRINAGVLLRAAGEDAASKEHVRAAIAIARRLGRTVPQAWVDHLGEG